MNQKPKIAVYTLGCRVNQFDSESICSKLFKQGFSRVPEFQPADFHIVNTCTVTNRGDSKSRQLIKKLVRMNIGKIVATGCSAQQDAEALADLGAHLVIDNTNKENIDVHLLNPDSDQIVHSDIMKVREFSQTPVDGFGGKARAHLKIQDGCSHYCTYCIIPFVRGRSRSLDFSEIPGQLETLLKAGYSEIVLTGIHIGHYNDKGKTLTNVLDLILNHPGNFRIRLSAIEPGEINDDILALFKAHPHKLCRHVHAAIQSGADPVLKRMRRRYSREDLRNLFENLYSIDPYFGIGVDLITGFPGETPEDFKSTKELIHFSPINYGHIFRFSPKKGTAAAEYPDQIPGAVKKERSSSLSSMINEKQMNFLKSHTGTIRPVLFESPTEGVTDNYIRVRIKAGKSAAGEIQKVRLTSNITQEKAEKFPVVDGVSV